MKNVSVFSESQVDILKHLYTNQIYSDFCHRGWNKKKTEKLSNNTSLFVELCAYMIPHFSNKVKIQRNPSFSPSRCQRWLRERLKKWGRRSVNMTYHNIDKIFIHECLPEPHQIPSCLEITYWAFFLNYTSQLINCKNSICSQQDLIVRRSVAAAHVWVY